MKKTANSFVTHAVGLVRILGLWSHTRSKGFSQRIKMAFFWNGSHSLYIYYRIKQDFFQTVVIYWPSTGHVSVFQKQDAAVTLDKQKTTEMPRELRR